MRRNFDPTGPAKASSVAEIHQIVVDLNHAHSELNSCKGDRKWIWLN
jgi:hypothetical protein